MCFSAFFVGHVAVERRSGAAAIRGFGPSERFHHFRPAEETGAAGAAPGSHEEPIRPGIWPDGWPGALPVGSPSTAAAESGSRQVARR